MRYVIELVLIAALIAFAWEKPLKEKLPWTAMPPPKAAATATPSGAWVHDPNRRTTLDTTNETFLPKDNSPLRDPSHRTPLDPPNKSATPREH